MNLETKITIYKFTPQVFTLTPNLLYHEKQIFYLYSSSSFSFVRQLYKAPNHSFRERTTVQSTYYGMEFVERLSGRHQRRHY